MEEKYFSSTLTLADKGSLPTGEHNFPFQFILPVTAPTSFEGRFGKIFYQIRATIETPRFCKNYKAQKGFYILNLLNLNEIPEIEQPNTVSTTKKFKYMLVKSGSLMLTVTSNLKGYTPGQVIQLQTDIHNKSGKDTGSILASLIMKAVYKSKNSVYDLRRIAEVEGSSVKAWKRAEWREQIIVPPLPQSFLHGCSLIDIDYFIKVSLRTPDVSVTLPLYIGNIAVNQAPLTPSRSVHHIPQEVLPSAPPAEEGEEDLIASGYQPMDNVRIPTKSHSQQQRFSYAPGLSFPEPQPDLEQSGSPAHPMLCVSTGATVPYYAEGAVTPIPTSCPLILPPEYTAHAHPLDQPPSYEESCSSANSSLSHEN
nr:PREDICTED: arrestin domain-containing protein 1 isoform X2 [Latimeria chalumnae]|eukprot:XP_014342090.1 PREDICTED: arrestin domain-containing protein 1 isoform X2 [Latimeria chalumnae]